MASGQPIPGLPPASDGEYSGHALIIFTAIFIPVQIICVALRYLARWVIKGPWGFDDILVFISLLLQLILAGISIGEHHSQIFHPAQRRRSLMLRNRRCQLRRSRLPHLLSGEQQPGNNTSVGEISRRHFHDLLWRRQHSQTRNLGSISAAFPRQGHPNPHPHHDGHLGRIDDIHGCDGLCGMHPILCQLECHLAGRAVY